MESYKKLFTGKNDILIILIITLIYIFTHFPLINILPVFGEEKYYIGGARSYNIPNKLDPNIEHPPLAKMIISLFIKGLGDNPYGWRLASLIFGLLSILLTYIFGKVLLESRVGGIFSALLVNFDFLHFVQSRIGTLDIFVSFFILLGLFCAYIYLVRYEKGYEKSIVNPWTIGGAISLGLGISSKLSAFSGFLASFILYFLVFYRKEKKIPIKKIFFLGSFYIGVMGIIFVISHIPAFLRGTPISRLLYRETMLLHYTMKFEHFHLTPIWKWPLLIHPYWYLYEMYKETQHFRGVLAWGNFIFWWGFLGIFIYHIYNAFHYKKRNSIFIIVGYLSLYLFWLLSFQIRNGFHFKGGFFFYMLPCVYIMAFAVADVMQKAWKVSIGKINVIIYFIGLLYMFYRVYPLLVGKIEPFKYGFSIFHIDLYVIFAVTLLLNLQLFMFCLPKYKRE